MSEVALKTVALRLTGTTDHRADSVLSIATTISDQGPHKTVLRANCTREVSISDRLPGQNPIPGHILRPEEARLQFRPTALPWLSMHVLSRKNKHDIASRTSTMQSSCGAFPVFLFLSVISKCFPSTIPLLIYLTTYLPSVYHAYLRRLQPSGFGIKHCYGRTRFSRSVPRRRVLFHAELTRPLRRERHGCLSSGTSSRHRRFGQ